MTLADVALAIDSDTGNLSRIERGLQRCTDEGLRKIAKALQVSVQSLFDDRVPAALPSTYKNNNFDVEPRKGGLVPVITWGQAAVWGKIVDSFVPGDAEQWVPCPVVHGPRTFVLRVRGISMFDPGGEQSFAEGDFIYVDPDVPVEPMKLVVAQFEGSHEAVFRQLIVDGNRMFLKALNPSWPNAIEPVPDDSSVIGVVIGKWVKV